MAHMRAFPFIRNFLIAAALAIVFVPVVIVAAIAGGVIDGLWPKKEPLPDSVLFLGNSITTHPPAHELSWTGNWGMAASNQQNDYVHRIVSAIEKQNGRSPQFLAMNIADFERGSFDESRIAEAIAMNPDAVVLAIGENMPKEDPLRRERVVALLQRFNGSAIYVRGCFWPDNAKDADLKAACDVVGGKFISVSHLGKKARNRAGKAFANSDVGAHPGDAGMQKIADAILSAMRHGLSPMRAVETSARSTVKVPPVVAPLEK